MQRAGDRVRINVQLIDTGTDEHLWAESFDRQLTAENVFSIQSEIAAAIAVALKAQLSPAEQANIETIPTRNLDAYDFYLLPESLEKERMIGQLQRDNFKKAFEAGAKMAFGSDGAVYPHGDNGKQFAYMVEYGMTPMQAIQAATVHAAELIGWPDDVGAIAPGRYADIIAVDGNPLDDVTVLENVHFVMKGGKIYKQ